MAKESQRIIIIGAGEVGFHAAEVLLHENRDITLIDRSRERLEEVEDILDVKTLAGFGADPDVLAKAEAHRADLVLAVTDNDEVNMLAAHIAKQLGTRMAVARSRNQAYVGSAKISLQRSLNLDLLISPEKLTAFEMAKFVDNPDIQAFQYFAMGRVEMQRIQLTQESFVINQPLIELQMPGLLVLLISRGEDLIVPSGQDMMLPGDIVTVVGESDQIHLLQSLFHFPDAKPQRVTIAGGGAIGTVLAQVLETRRFTVSLIEKDRARAEALSETLPRTTVIHGDATRLSFVKDERIGESDIFLAVMGEDEDNLMACLLARDQGAAKTAAVIRRPDYGELIEKIGIDAAVSPRQLTSNRIASLVRRSGVASAAVIEDGAATILEFRVRPESPIVNRKLIDIDFPEGALLAMVSRGERVFVPKGEDKIETGDTVVGFALAKSVDRLERLFVK